MAGRTRALVLALFALGASIRLVPVVTPPRGDGYSFLSIARALQREGRYPGPVAQNVGFVPNYNGPALPILLSTFSTVVGLPPEDIAASRVIFLPLFAGTFFAVCAVAGKSFGRTTVPWALLLLAVLPLEVLLTSGPYLEVLGLLPTTLLFWCIAARKRVTIRLALVLCSLCCLLSLTRHLTAWTCIAAFFCFLTARAGKTSGRMRVMVLAMIVLSTAIGWSWYLRDDFGLYRFFFRPGGAETPGFTPAHQVLFDSWGLYQETPSTIIAYTDGSRQVIRAVMNGWVFAILVGSGVTVAGICLMARRGNGPSLVALIFLVAAIATALSGNARQLLYPRYAVMYGPILCIAFGVGMAKLKTALGMKGDVVALLVAFLVGATVVPSLGIMLTERQRHTLWPGLLTAAGDMTPRDAVILVPSGWPIRHYYMDRPLLFPDLASPWGDLWPTRIEEHLASSAMLADYLLGYDVTYIWIDVYPQNQPTNRPVYPQTMMELLDDESGFSPLFGLDRIGKLIRVDRATLEDVRRHQT